MLEPNGVQVWSFSPPEDELDDYRSGSPASMEDFGERPHSALAARADSKDITMSDAPDAAA
jgi:F-box and WD-40 domain protein CDC4